MSENNNVIPFPERPPPETEQQAARRRLKEKHQLLDAQGYAAWLARHFGPETDR